MGASERVRFGLYLKGLRAERRMSLRQVAAATGNMISASYLSQVENAVKPPPNAEVLAALAKALGAETTEVFRRAGVRDAPPQDVYDPDDLRRAFQMVVQDPRYAFGTYVTDQEVTFETMAFIVEMYQKARGLKLINRRGEEEDSGEEGG